MGINVQPNAVRELYDMGLGAEQLDTVGICYARVGAGGPQWQRHLQRAARRLAGYQWPQYSVHRGQLQMLLYRTVLERLGPQSVQLGQRVVGYRNVEGGVVAQLESRDGTRSELAGRMLIGADGLHSAIRAQMHPTQPPIQWGGAIMWRGVTQGQPIRTGASFIGLGSARHRVVFYPISQPDPATGLATINWIAEITVDNAGGWRQGDWNRRVAMEEFAHHFDGWNFGWVDVPAMLRGASEVFEYPMIDREPIPTWVDGRVALMGDAAHVMYSTGSNGASQAIVDARVLGAMMLRHGATPEALATYDDRCARRSRPGAAQPGRQLRPAQPGGRALWRVFDDIDAVVPCRSARPSWRTTSRPPASTSPPSTPRRPPSHRVSASRADGQARPGPDPRRGLFLIADAQPRRRL